MSQKPHDISMLKAKVRKALANIGKANGQACPPTDSNVDPVLHELFVTSEATSYFKLRHEKARDEALRVAFGPGELEKLTDRVVKNNQGENLIPVEGTLYTMTMDISRPAVRLDATALRNYMVTQLKLSPAVVETAFVSCTVPNTPTKRVKVLGR